MRERLFHELWKVCPETVCLSKVWPVFCEIGVRTYYISQQTHTWKKVETQLSGHVMIIEQPARQQQSIPSSCFAMEMCIESFLSIGSSSWFTMKLSFPAPKWFPVSVNHHVLCETADCGMWRYTRIAFIKWREPLSRLELIRFKEKNEGSVTKPNTMFNIIQVVEASSGSSGFHDLLYTFCCQGCHACICYNWIMTVQTCTQIPLSS